MIKRTIPFVAALIFAASLIGCGPSEENVNIPTGKPGDGGPQPTSVSAAGGGAPAPESGGTQAPQTD